jgi:hypothetical protein
MAVENRPNCEIDPLEVVLFGGESEKALCGHAAFIVRSNGIT